MKNEPKKCFVKGCLNYSDQGRFVGDLCAPCREMLETGRVHHRNLTFVGKLSQENLRLSKIVQEVHNWAVCGCIAPPEDLMQNLPHIIAITKPEGA